MTNLSREDLINESKIDLKSIALIYSPIELYEYIIEIISSDSDQFIHKTKNSSHIYSIDEAIYDAEKHGAVDFYFCISNTYDEFGSVGSSQPYDYMRIYSKNKNHG